MLTIMIVASRYMDMGNNATDLRLEWLQYIEREIVNNSDLISLPKLQIILLLIYDRKAKGNLTSVYFLVAIASRIAYGLGLNSSNERIPFLNQECRRRLMWCIYSQDRLLSSESSLYKPLCERESLQIQMPSNEHHFLFEIECATGLLEDVSNSPSSEVTSGLGSSAYLIRILSLRCHQKDTLQQAGNLNSQNLSHFQQELNHFGANLPSYLRNNERALFTQANTPDNPTFVMVQSWWHSTFCELFERYACTSTTGTVENTDITLDLVRFCEDELERYAMALNRYWQQAYRLSKTSFLHWDIVPIVLHNANLLLFLLQKNGSSSDQLIEIRQGIEFDLELLSGLGKWSEYAYAVVSSLIRHLRL